MSLHPLPCHGAGAAAGLALSAALDALAGEPPLGLHPVRWLGALLGAVERRALGRPEEALAWGAAAMAVGLGMVGGVAAWLEARLVGPFWAGAGWVELGLATAAYAALLKPAFATRALVQAGFEVEQALGAGDLARARQLTGWHLVSRPTADLEAPLVAAAAVESLAENTGDSVVAPLFWWALLGLPGAWCYRLVNTADAMWGYHGDYERLGKAAARLDDVLSYLPSRLAAALLVAAGAGRKRGSRRRALRVWRRDAGLTESPNAGHPMAAAAGLLGIRLEKVGAYTLHPEGRPPGPEDLRRARAVVSRAATAAFLLAALAGAALRCLPGAGPALALVALAAGIRGAIRHTRRPRAAVAPQRRQEGG